MGYKLCVHARHSDRIVIYTACLFVFNFFVLHVFLLHSVCLAALCFSVEVKGEIKIIITSLLNKILIKYIFTIKRQIKATYPFSLLNLAHDVDPCV